jgi:hypothetical protein
MKKDELEAKLLIDEYGLDVSLRENPDLFYKVSFELAYAISERDEAKNNLAKIEAEVDKRLRRDAAIGGTKTTEKEIECNKQLDREVIEASEKYMDRKLAASLWEVLKEAYEKRSFALSSLVDLYSANYFSDVGERNAKDRHSSAQVQQIKMEAARQRNEMRGKYAD